MKKLRGSDAAYHKIRNEILKLKQQCNGDSYNIFNGLPKWARSQRIKEFKIEFEQTNKHPKKRNDINIEYKHSGDGNGNDDNSDSDDNSNNDDIDNQNNTKTKPIINIAGTCVVGCTA